MTTENAETTQPAPKAARRVSPKDRLIASRNRFHPDAPIQDAPKEPTEDPSSDLMLAANAIFDGGSNTFKLASGKEVIIRPATMKHLSKIMEFFGNLITSVDPTKFSSLVETLVIAQKLAIARGEDPNNISLRDFATDDIVSKAFDHVSIMSLIMAATFDTLPGIVSLFTNLTPEEYADLPFDEGALIAGGHFPAELQFFYPELAPDVNGIHPVVGKQKSRQESAKEREKLGLGIWLNQSVQRLRQKGHSLGEIKNYTLAQFMMFVDAERQVEAEFRMSFVADLSVVVGSLFSEHSPIKEHIGGLEDTAMGAKHGSSEQPVRRNHPWQGRTIPGTPEA